MSFFFNKPTSRNGALSKATGASKFASGSPSARRNVGMLHRAGCAACPLNHAPGVTTRRMEPTLAKNTLIYFLAEAPDRHEDEVARRPLTGPMGKLLRECIPDGDEEYSSFDNTVNCRPEGDRPPVWNE